MDDAAQHSSCLNCGAPVRGNFCSNCGQRVQPTKVPLRVFAEDAVQNFLNIDNRLISTIKDLFVSPGKVTKRYIAGERVKFVSPMRLYIWVSVIYFIIVSLIDTHRFFLINVDMEGHEKEFGKYLQSSMFLLIPVFGLIVWLVQKKLKRFYVEHLIFAIHLHVVWYALSIVYALADYGLSIYPDFFLGPKFFKAFQYLSQAGTLVYLILYIKNVYGQGWLKSIFKAWLVLMLYAIVLLAVSILFTKLI